jgi:hypothetical protein
MLQYIGKKIIKSSKISPYFIFFCNLVNCRVEREQPLEDL